MIAFGCSVSEPEPYARYAEPGIRLAAEPESEILSYAAVGTIGRTYNVLLDAAARHEDLEALVLVHPHAEIADPALCQKVREALRDPDVAVVGCAGATEVTGIAWWDGAVSTGSVTQRYLEHGGGELPAFAWAEVAPAPREVEVVDGFVLVLSPWAARNLRFDEGLFLGHGFDVDFCLQAHSAGRKVMTGDIRVVLHRSLEIVSDLELWVEAHIAVAGKWDGQMPGRQHAEQDPQRRARRAEAEREAARAIAYSKRLSMDARLQELEQAMEEASATMSWRLTAPLRKINKWRRDRAAARKSQTETEAG
jgi:hypothetical protein